MLRAVFFPINPEALAFDLQQSAAQAIKAGLKLYTNGRQVALLPSQMPGWFPFGGIHKCAA